MKIGRQIRKSLGLESKSTKCTLKSCTYFRCQDDAMPRRRENKKKWREYSKAQEDARAREGAKEVGRNACGQEQFGLKRTPDWGKQSIALRSSRAGRLATALTTSTSLWTPYWGHQSIALPFSRAAVLKLCSYFCVCTKFGKTARL